MTVDVVGCSAPACEVEVPDAGPLLKVLGATQSRSSNRLHPLSTIAVEWCAPFAWTPAWSALWAEHGGRVVHAWHDIQVHRHVATPAGCRLAAEVVCQRTTGAGALVVVRYDGTDADGPVWTTHAAMLWRGLKTVDRGAVTAPVLDTSAQAAHAIDLHVAEGYARTYSEVSGIWNPIHTDAEAARAAGLGAPILHGSATLGLSLVAAAEQAAVDAVDWRRVSAWFLAPVTPPDRLTVLAARGDRTLVASTTRGDGTPVLAAAVELAAETTGGAS